MSINNNEIYGNKIQNQVINKGLNGLLINNEILIKKIILSFLNDNCYHCNEFIVNPIEFNNKSVCINCINLYTYCNMKNCKKTKFHKNIKFYQRCSKCLAWYCNKHRPFFSCYCQGYKTS